MGSWFSTTTYKVATIGFSGAGKTTLVNKICNEKETNPVPTIGVDLKKIKIRGLTFSIWDLGGQDATQAVWGPYLIDSHVVIYSIDLEDVDRMHQSFEKLRALLARYPTTFQTTPVIVVGNKIDVTLPQNSKSLFEAELKQTIKEHHEKNLAFTSKKNRFIPALISAKENINVDEVIDTIVGEIEAEYTSIFWQYFSAFVYPDN